MIYGFLLIGIGVVTGFISSMMFGDIMLSGMIGALSIILSGLGFINLDIRKRMK